MAGTLEGASKRDRDSWAKGERCRHSKLSPDKVLEIRAAVERRKLLRAELKTLTNAALAEQHGVGERAIEDIATGATWGHL